jgi:signal peptidase
MPLDYSKLIFYRGPSMNPTLKVPDMLYLLPYQDGRILPGDVVVFRPPNSKRLVVHRVVSVDAEAIRTRGDNNRRIDPWVITPDRVIGRVVEAQRGSRYRSLSSGARGRIHLQVVRANRALALKLARLLAPVYHRLARRGVFRRWLPRRRRMRVVSFERPGGRELRLLLGRSVIGHRVPGGNGWEIRPPFRLFVDEESLP